MKPQLLNEAFSAKITIITKVFRVAVNTYVLIFQGLDARVCASCFLGYPTFNKINLEPLHLYWLFFW